MNNLSPRDTLLLIVLVNIICYWIGYQFILTPLLGVCGNLHEEYKVAVEECKELEYEASQADVYLAKISELNKIRRDEVNSKFYKTVTTEKFHKWFTNLKNSQFINLSSFNIVRNITTSSDSSGETSEVDFVDNQVTLNFKATYDNLINLLEEIENDGRASILSKISISPNEGMLSTNLTYSFYSINKGDGEDASFSLDSLNLGSPNESKTKLNLAAN